MSKLRDLMQKMGIMRSVESPEVTEAEMDAIEKSWPDPPPYGWSAESVEQLKHDFESERERGAVGLYSTPEEKFQAEADFVKSAMREILISEAAHDIKCTMNEGFADGIRFHQLDRHSKLELLGHIDWTEYANRGLDMETAQVMMFNAVDDKSPTQWLKQTPEEAKSRQAEMDGWAAQGEAARERISENIKTFEQDLAQAATQPRKEQDRTIEME